MKLFLKIVLSIVIIFVLAGAGGIFYLTRGLDAGKNLVIDSMNTSQLRDGTYDGKYSSGRWSNEVKVTVRDQKIVKIDVVKDVLFPKPEATQELISRVIEAQNTNVDIVSGATITSKAYLKAIENALKRR